MVFLKEFFQKVDFEKNQQTTKNMKNYPVGNELTDDDTSNNNINDDDNNDDDNVQALGGGSFEDHCIIALQHMTVHCYL